MKFQPLLILLLATQLMAAAPPVQPPATASTWDKIKNGALRLVPKAPTPSQSGQRTSHVPPEFEVETDRAGSALGSQPADVRRDAQVRQATAVEKVPRAATATRSKKTSRPARFSREKRPSRTLSQYMAEEKP